FEKDHDDAAKTDADLLAAVPQNQVEKLSNDITDLELQRDRAKVDLLGAKGQAGSDEQVANAAQQALAAHRMGPGGTNRSDVPNGWEPNLAMGTSSRTLTLSLSADAVNEKTRAIAGNRVALLAGAKAQVPPTDPLNVRIAQQQVGLAQF